MSSISHSHPRESKFVEKLCLALFKKWNIDDPDLLSISFDSQQSPVSFYGLDEDECPNKASLSEGFFRFHRELFNFFFKI